jgi:hypothetical protein
MTPRVTDRAVGLLQTSLDDVILALIFSAKTELFEIAPVIRYRFDFLKPIMFSTIGANKSDPSPCFLINDTPLFVWQQLIGNNSHFVTQWRRSGSAIIVEIVCSKSMRPVQYSRPLYCNWVESGVSFNRW